MTEVLLLKLKPSLHTSMLLPLQPSQGWLFPLPRSSHLYRWGRVYFLLLTVLPAILPASCMKAQALHLMPLDQELQAVLTLVAAMCG